MQPSEEQSNIINKLSTHNIVVRAVAGSGKTTTNIFIAQQYSNKRILLLTYNNRLKLETRSRITKLGITNMEVHSYHSFAVKYYSGYCHTDSGLFNMLKESSTMDITHCYDIIIIDEVQDMTKLYYELVCFILKNNVCFDDSIERIQTSPWLIILGDIRQMIYKFKGASVIFMMNTELFTFNNPSSREWVDLPLSTSYRLTKEIADFVNFTMLKEDLIRTCKNGPRPIYINIVRTRPMRAINMLCDVISQHKSEEIFVLAPSLKSEKSNVKKFANKLSEKGYNLYISLNESDTLKDDDLLANKIVFTTFHQAKGLERPVIIVFNFDQAYFQYFNKEADPLQCTNELYVAVTRSSNKLYLVANGPALSFLDFNRWHCDGDRPTIEDVEIDHRPSSLHAVTKLIEYLPIDVIKECMTCFTTKEYSTSIDIVDPIKLESRIKIGDITEEVSDINGMLIPIQHYCKSLGDFELDVVEELRDKGNIKISSISVTRDMTIEQVIRTIISNVSCISGYINRMKQITKYDWIPKETLEKCLFNINAITKNPPDMIEKAFSRKLSYENSTIYGQVDCIIENIAWEFKCGELKEEHFIQTALYKFLTKGAYRHIVFNVLTCEAKEIIADDRSLEHMVITLLTSKEGIMLSEALEIKKKYFED